MRLPYVDKNPTFSDEKDNEVVKRVLARRGDRGLIPLDRALLHSPPVADGWNSFLGAIRTGATSITPTIKELAICRIAVLNRAWFEWDAHFPILQKSAPEFITEKVELYLLNQPVHQHDASTNQEARETGLGELELAVLDYADSMTRDVDVGEEVWGRLRRAFEGGEEGKEGVERRITELTVTVAGYNCVSRFLVALDVGERNGSREGKV